MTEGVFGIRTEGGLSAWFEGASSRLMGAATAFPPCFGAVYRVGPEAYVPEELFFDVLPSAPERDLWLLIANGADRCEAFEHIRDNEWLSESASLSAADGPCFFALVLESDYTPDELDRLRSERPDLFDSDGEPAYGDPRLS